MMFFLAIGLWMEVGCIMGTYEGKGQVGQACNGSPHLGGCVEGAYCVEERMDPNREVPHGPHVSRFRCRKACNSNSDCDRGETCEAVPEAPYASVCRPSLASFGHATNP
ncbi:MAG: hypothetical protein RMJ84_06440 [Sandaracinaceae bacterium]|nr:hypothetical protein [Sandaracinaceae bacterium]